MQAQAGFGGVQAGMQSLGLGGAPTAGGRPTVRNPIMVMVIPIAAIMVGPIVGGVLAGITEMAVLGLLGLLITFAGVGYILFNIMKMSNELKVVTGNEAFAWWPLLVPVYSYYWAWILVPAEMAKAKQMRGIQTPARSILLYLLLFPYAFASDLNDIAQAAR